MTLHRFPQGAPEAAAPPGGFEEDFNRPGDVSGTPVVNRTTVSGDTWEYIPLPASPTYVDNTDFQVSTGQTCGRVNPTDKGNTESGGWWYDTGSDDHWLEIDFQSLARTNNNIAIGWALGFDLPNKATQRFFGVWYSYNATPAQLQLGFWYVTGNIWTPFPNGASNINITQAQTIQCVLTRDDPAAGQSTLAVTPLSEPGLAKSYVYSGFGSDAGTRAGFVYGNRFAINGLFGPVRIGAGSPP